MENEMVTKNVNFEDVCHLNLQLSWFGQGLPAPAYTALSPNWQEVETYYSCHALLLGPKARQVPSQK
jgi:hypothetical protein